MIESPPKMMQRKPRTLEPFGTLKQWTRLKMRCLEKPLVASAVL
ncbi:hypothetical protein X975_08695, partial [Stegodyphus mimosarum]